MRAHRFADSARALALGALTLFIVLSAATARADEAKAGGVAVIDAWARASSVKTGAVYLTLRNTGATADRLSGISTAVASMAQLHVSKEENGVMRMRPVDGIDLPPGASVTLKPGGYHIMLMGLTQPLAAGDSFPLVLTFDKGGAVTVTVAVKAAGATGAGTKPMGDMDMTKPASGN